MKQFSKMMVGLLRYGDHSDTKFITLDQVLSKLQLVQRRGPFLAAVLDFTITKIW